MALPARTTVLIVGAGPCGMAAALSLHHQGIRDFAIVDAVLAGENSSRALVIQAATLEALDTVGCLDRLLGVGEKMDLMRLHDGTSYLMAADFSLLAPYTKYPFGLVLPQSSTEAGMLERLDELGIKVLRPFKVVSLKSSPDTEGSIDVGFESGEVIQAKYVIGADGARSVVRHEAGIDFNDPDGDEEHDYGSLSQMALGDVTFSSPPQFPAPATRTLATVAGGNFTLVVPLPASVAPDPHRTVYRLALGVPPGAGPAPHAPDTAYLQALLDRCGAPALSSDPAVNPHPMLIAETYWSSRYRTRSAVAARCFAHLGGGGGGTVLLIGDAAHIHSPIGGQGMSLGIRDAISLGAALRAHIESEGTATASSDTLLTTWAADRHARALSVIALTKQTLRVITAPPSHLRWLGLAVLRFLGRFSFVRRMVAYRISGLAEYR